ncbi:MAG: sigma-E factor negative regulatory protein [Rudaea sp.]|uniref:sigma-E factor negative regulatory protein n=1 Tax=Rudaea sp. TaxID=2136325 RepID=UPI0039E3E86D
MSEQPFFQSMNPNQAIADSLGEQLSALMDGELARDQVRFLLRGVEAQTSLARRWSSYQIIGASLRREYVAVALPADFAHSVIGRLDGGTSVAVPVPSRRIGIGALRWIGGGAIAAAVAVVALTVTRPVNEAAAPAVALAEQTSVLRPSSQPYLPLARPLPGTNSPVFGSDAMRPASFEQVLPSYYLPGGVEPLPNRIETGRSPYLLRLPVQDPTVPAQR